MQLPALDLAVIAAYFLAMIGIGIYSVKIATTRDDYLVAGRRLNTPMFFGAMAATAVGGAVTVGGAQKGFADGVAGIWVGGSLGLGLILLGALVSSKLQGLHALSINEVIERNYGRGARVLGAILTIIYTIALSVVQVVAMGAILAAVMGWNTTTAMLLSGGVVVFYTLLGGMWSVTLTDVAQFIIKTLGIVILFPVFALFDDRIGGVSGLVDQMPATHLNPFAFGFQGTLYWILLYVPGLVIGQDIWQRVFTARTDRIAKRGTLAAGVYAIIYAAAAVLVGICVAIVAPNIDKKQAFATGVVEFLPTGIAGLLLAAAIAASMSVASGTILACSTVVYNDIYQRFLRGTSGEDTHGSAMERHLEAVAQEHNTKRDMWVNRGIAGVIGLTIMVLSVLIEDIFKALDLSYGFLSGAVFVPVFAAFILRKVSAMAGTVSLAFGFVGVAGSMIYGQSVGNPDWSIGGNFPIMVGMSLGTVSYVVVTLLDHQKHQANVGSVPDK